MENKLKTFLKEIIAITDKEFDVSLSYFRKVNLKKGEFFVQQNNICHDIAFIEKGTLRNYYINDKAEEITSCFCTENSFATSYKSFILQKPSNLILQAIENTQLLLIDYHDLQKLYTKYPVWQSLGRIMAEREYFIMEEYASILNNETAKEKYLRLLKEQPTVLQKAKIEDIASYLGITRRTLSRIRKEISN